MLSNDWLKRENEGAISSEFVACGGPLEVLFGLRVGYKLGERERERRKVSIWSKEEFQSSKNKKRFEVVPQKIGLNLLHSGYGSVES